MTQMRTHNCNELRISDAGKKVTLVGWMENVREVGSNLAFVILRDFYGTTQVVVETPEMLEIFSSIIMVYTFSVDGVVIVRSI